ncbi:uncharacterized protein LOC111696880 [Eurytemora carolleeae]|uniref:uncharacterized protein LOC111696880 n=1 Tax=Eurytemora carolleeae TaxID=1294199 RepID=UPI000C77ABDF|nr:uncharacterized protein LOC111696880 [Eurytemora carolleeae]|eukprot:XP_023322414.1 uncharacterized protein LOC111696880 [Eurytemora affinis]
MGTDSGLNVQPVSRRGSAVGSEIRGSDPAPRVRKNSLGSPINQLRSPVPSRRNMQSVISSRPSSRSSSNGSRTSRSSRSFYGHGVHDSIGPVLDGNIRVLTAVDCGNEIFSLRYTEDGSDVCVGLMDGSIKVINPPSNQIISVLASQETARNASLLR